MKTWHKVLILFTLVGLIALQTGCSNQSDNTNVSTPKNSNNSKDTLGPVQNTDFSITYEDEVFYLKDGQVLDMNQNVNLDGITWVVSNMEITKEIGSRDQEEFNFFGEEINAFGNLVGEQSYVFVTLSCKNTDASTQEALLNSNGFVVVNQNMELCETASEARYISKVQEGNTSIEKAFHYILKPGEETGSIEIGYIIDDTFLNDYENIYYCIGFGGSELGSPDNRYIEVNTAQ